MRGKGGKESAQFHLGVDTRKELDKAAEKRHMNISSWSEEERAKSHGPAKKFYKSQKYGKPSLISQFFDEGSWVNEEILPGNPNKDAKECVYRERAKQGRLSRFHLVFKLIFFFFSLLIMGRGIWIFASKERSNYGEDTQN